MSHPLHSHPLYQSEDLGFPIPNSLHAVSVCLPTWNDVIGYEEKESRVIDRMKTGYPRFFLHPLIQQVCQVLAPAEGFEALPFSDEIAAQECAALTGGIAKTVNGMAAAFFPTSSQATARAYWQHAGRILSSRAAEDWLKNQILAKPNPHLEWELRNRLAGWSGGSAEKISLHPSGMAAIYAAFQTLLSRRPGQRMVMFGFPYTDTLKILQKFGPGVEFFARGDEADLQRLGELLEKEQIAGIFCEVPSNPLLHTPNLPALADFGRRFGIPVVVDDTIGTTFNVDVLPYCDLVATSLTKAISGEGDVMAGALLCCSKLADLESFLPSTHGIYSADLEVLEKNSRDFPERMQICNANALELARFLSTHPTIESVWHPSLNPSSAYERLRKPQGGYGAVLSFLPKNAKRNSPEIFERLQVNHGISLGTSYTLVCPYVQLAHYQELDWAKSCGIDPYLLRVAVGTEPIHELLHRFQTALG